MHIEYHGWIALATSHDDWCNGDLADAFGRVEEALEQLRPEDGQEARMPDCDLLPKVVYLKGSEAESLDAVLRVLQETCTIFDRAYGELTVFRVEDPNDRWAFSRVTRYPVVDGRITEVNGKSRY